MQSQYRSLRTNLAAVKDHGKSPYGQFQILTSKADRLSDLHWDAIRPYDKRRPTTVSMNMHSVSRYEIAAIVVGVDCIDPQH
jgi:hypothetical protein